MGNTTSNVKLNSYGWYPDLPDHRDKILKFPRAKSLPNKVDLRDLCPPVYDHGSIGSSTICSVLAAYRFGKKDSNFIPSRLFLYYNTRLSKQAVDRDAGASIRDCLKALNRHGLCSESLWPYDLSNLCLEPSASCKAQAVSRGAITYQRIVQNHEQIKSCIASGQPIIFGMSIFPSLLKETVAQTGIVPMPEADETILGGQSALLVGYDDEESCWIVLTSWGEKFGDKGYIYLPYDYFFKEKKFITDLWVMKTL